MFWSLGDVEVVWSLGPIEYCFSGCFNHISVVSLHDSLCIFVFF
jgi:hypothetical protein